MYMHYILSRMIKQHLLNDSLQSAKENLQNMPRAVDNGLGYYIIIV